MRYISEIHFIYRTNMGKIVIKEMGAVAANCFKKPGKALVWAPEKGKYVCNRDPEFARAMAQQTPQILAAHPQVSSTFNLVFLTVVAGVVLSFACCGVLAALSGQNPPQMHKELFSVLLDVGKVGVGTILGLLGGKVSKGAK